ncbi:serine/threonine-protein kinase-like [Tropilaelaps mercedesae]|uniref:Serine/threonine-protein kinase-like n=1 Tax=Tropilaelaps mercedesae TaxID=418985 RepID=A0A1V9XB32_9ACAR|nr:serine/threonine-protein kinase-like [Tropilaelaps mercedesae]
MLERRIENTPRKTVANPDFFLSYCLFSSHSRGKFATVRRCRHIESGRDFAAKYLRKQRRAEDVRHELIHEALVLALADDCGRIISLKEIFETRTEVILVLEMAAGGELQHVLDAEDCLPERSVRELLLQIAEGLAFLHSQHIAHLDIKPANLLLASAWPQVDAKLCDFGISRLILPGEEIHEIAGTPDYIAPEVLQYEPISLATDMWSLGILTYVLLTGHTPFGGDTKQDTYCNITLGVLDFPQDLFEDVTPEAVHFITQLVVKDPKKRLTIGEVLKHPWLTQPPPSPSSMTISPVIGVTTDNADYLLNGNSRASINNINAACGLSVNADEPAALQGQQQLCPGAAVQCETPSSSSMGSLEESDAEIVMEDQRQHESELANGGYANGNTSSSVNGSRVERPSNGEPTNPEPSKAAPSLDEVVDANGDLPAEVADDLADNEVPLEHSQTVKQLVEVHDSSEEESEYSELDSDSSDSVVGDDPPVQITDVTDDPESQGELEEQSATPLVTDSEDVLPSPDASHSNIHALYKNRKILLSRLATKEHHKQLLQPSGSVSSTTTSKSVSAADMRRPSAVKRRPSKKSRVKSKSQSNLKETDKSQNRPERRARQDTVVERSKLVVSPEAVAVQSVRPKTPVPKSLEMADLERRTEAISKNDATLTAATGPKATSDRNAITSDCEPNTGVSLSAGVEPSPTGSAECNEMADSYRKIKVTMVSEGEPLIQEPRSDAKNSTECVLEVVSDKTSDPASGRGRVACPDLRRPKRPDDDRYEIESVTSETAQNIETKRANDIAEERGCPQTSRLSVFDRISQRAAKFMDMPMREPRRSPRTRFCMTDFVQADESNFRESNDLFQDFELRHGDLIGRVMMEFPFRKRGELGLSRKDLEKVHLREYNALAKFDTAWQYEKEVPLLAGELRGRCPFTDRLSRFDGTPRPKAQPVSPPPSDKTRPQCDAPGASSFPQQIPVSFECEPQVAWQYQDNSSTLNDRNGRLHGDQQKATQLDGDFSVHPDSMWQYQDTIPILHRPSRSIPVKGQTFEDSIQHRRQKALNRLNTASLHASEDLFTEDDHALISRIMGTDLGDGLPVFRRTGFNDPSSVMDQQGDGFERRPATLSGHRATVDDGRDAEPPGFAPRRAAYGGDGDTGLYGRNGKPSSAEEHRSNIADGVATKPAERPKRAGGNNLNKLLTKLDEWEMKIKGVREDEDFGYVRVNQTPLNDSGSTGAASRGSNLAEQLANASSKVHTRTEKIVESADSTETFKEYSMVSFSSGVKQTMSYRRSEVKKI